MPRFLFVWSVNHFKVSAVGRSADDDIRRMKNLIIIGARGAGREVYNTALRSKGYKDAFDVKGFLDGKGDALDGYDNYPPILSSVEDYQPEPDDIFVCALGEPKWRKYYASIIIEKGGKFTTLIDPTATIGTNVQIGQGCIVREYAVISCDVTIGDFVYIQPFADMGHDSVVGNYCHLNTRAFMGGYSKMEDMAVIQTHGVLVPHKVVYKGGVIGAGSVAIRNVKAGTTVVGNPAKKIEY